jgi:hypothetical protein
MFKTGIIGAEWIAEKMSRAVGICPHQETISIMKQMDALRKEWGVVYPMD